MSPTRRQSSKRRAEQFTPWERSSATRAFVARAGLAERAIASSYIPRLRGGLINPPVSYNRRAPLSCKEAAVHRHDGGGDQDGQSRQERIREGGNLGCGRPRAARSPCRRVPHRTAALAVDRHLRRGRGRPVEHVSVSRTG